MSNHQLGMVMGSYLEAWDECPVESCHSLIWRLLRDTDSSSIVAQKVMAFFSARHRIANLRQVLVRRKSGFFAASNVKFWTVATSFPDLVADIIMQKNGASSKLARVPSQPKHTEEYSQPNLSPGAPVDAHSILSVGFQAGMDPQPDPTAECDFDECNVLIPGVEQTIVFRCDHSYHITCANTCAPCMDWTTLTMLANPEVATAAMKRALGSQLEKYAAGGGGGGGGGRVGGRGGGRGGGSDGVGGGEDGDSGNSSNSGDSGDGSGGDIGNSGNEMADAADNTYPNEEGAMMSTIELAGVVVLSPASELAPQARRRGRHAAGPCWIGL